MSLPRHCKRIQKHEKNFVAEALAQRSFGEPFFEVHDNAFLEILGETPKIELGVEKDWPFAHEAGVYFPDQDACYITSNTLKTESGKSIKIGKVTRNNGQWQYEEIQTDVAMGNGGINYQSGVLFCDQGTVEKPGGLVLMEAQAPVNDVVLHTDGSIWFTDPIYGYEQGFRSAPQLPAQVYRFDPESGDIRAVADGFQRPNGLCFSPDEQTMYVTDTDWIHGDGTTDLSRASSIYAFDVLERHGSQFLANKRLFAMADEGVPDGIKCDLQGNVYSGCGDGVSVWSAGGKLLGKIKIPGGAANFCFAQPGELLVLNETKFWAVSISSKIQGALLSNMKIEV